MTADAMGSPRLAEVFLAELIGRDLGPFETIGVAGLEHPAGFTCEIGSTHEITESDEVVATLSVEETAVEIIGINGERQIRIDDGGSIKPALDALLQQLGISDGPV